MPVAFSSKTSKLSKEMLAEGKGYFRVLRNFQRSQSLMSDLSLAIVSPTGELLSGFSHPQDKIHEFLIADVKLVYSWLQRASENDFCVISTIGNALLMCHPVRSEDEIIAYVVTGPVWEAPPNHEQRCELAECCGFSESKLREALLSHPAKIPLDLTKGREVTTSLAVLTSDLLSVYLEQCNGLDTFRKLYKISTKLGESLDLEEIVNTVIDGALTLVPSTGCSLALIDDEQDTITINFRDTSDSQMSRVDRIPLNGKLAIYEETCSRPSLENNDGISSITLPVYIEGKCRGYIELVSDLDDEPYTDNDMQMLQIMSGHASSAIEKSLMYTRALRQFRELEALQEVGIQLSSSVDTMKTLRQILDYACALLDAQTASVMLLDADKQTLRIRLATGLPEDIIKTTVVKLGERISGNVANNGEPALLPNGDCEFGDDRSSSMCVPLKADGRIIGVLNVRGRADAERFTTADLNLALRLANMSATAIQTAELHDELQQLFLESITALANSIDARDRYTRGHSERVADYSLLIGNYLNLSQSELWRLRNAALLHDIGKIKIPDRILNKPDKLTDEEFAIMKLHPVYGAEIMQPVKSFASIVPFMLYHHEKYDGSGYPEHKRGEDIPFFARIISVADSFDAMTSTRPYRRCMDTEKAIRIITECRGTQLDAYLVNIFTTLYRQGKLDAILERARVIEDDER